MSVLFHVQHPVGAPKGRLVLLHGLEGSSQAGYMRSMAASALQAGYAAYRGNMRSCGGTEHLSHTMYHAGLTSDLQHVVEQLHREDSSPIFLVGFSLGGNVVLKLAGELGEQGWPLLAGVGAVSTPIDLAACVAQMERRQNWIYENRFLDRLKKRIRARDRHQPGRYSLKDLARARSVREFDDLITAKAFDFGTAADYYATQSCQNFLASIRVPTLIVQAKDDPLIPPSLFAHPALSKNPCLHLLMVERGGHLGFLSRRKPRFWLDHVVVEWVEQIRNGRLQPCVP